jgi:glyoxylase-like metal-dependent hydrolase (beta-lactamase superfamily II)
MSIDRRGFMMAGAALAASAGLAGCAATPAQPAPARRIPGVSTFRLGSWSVTSISDGHFERPLAEGFVRNAKLAQVQAALEDAGLPTDRVTIPLNCFLVDTGPRKVLIDTGTGSFGAPTSGRLMAHMGAAGIDPASIDTVLISHFHGDHINGLRDREGRAVFPNARVMVPAPEWDWWMDDRRMNAQPVDQRGGFAAARRVFGPMASTVERFEPGRELLPGIVSMPAYGHTAGHTMFMLSSGGQRMLYWGDLTNIAALFVRNPDWQVSFDMDPEAARRTRRRVMEMALAENVTVAGFHLENGGVGRLARQGSGYRFTPLAA